MPQNVLITGAGKAVGLGFNLVLRYLEAGDYVAATIRKPCAELEELQKQYSDKLTILTMDIGSTSSVQAAAEELAMRFDHPPDQHFRLFQRQIRSQRYPYRPEDKQTGTHPAPLRRS